MSDLFTLGPSSGSLDTAASAPRQRNGGKTPRQRRRARRVCAENSKTGRYVMFGMFGIYDLLCDHWWLLFRAFALSVLFEENGLKNRRAATF